jgi:hypothetical protein
MPLAHRRYSEAFHDIALVIDHGNADVSVSSEVKRRTNGPTDALAAD